MDHSWLLKINEVPASEAVEQVPKNVSDFIVTFDDSAQIKNAAKDATKVGCDIMSKFKTEFDLSVTYVIIF